MSCSICAEAGGNECPKCFADYCDNHWYLSAQSEIWRCSDPFGVGCEMKEYHLTLEEFNQLQNYENKKDYSEKFGSDERMFGIDK